MTASNLNTQIRVFDSLPRRIQSAVVAYANAAKLSPASVIEFTLTHFLELEGRLPYEQGSFIEDGSILSELPPLIQTAIAQYASENEMPPEFVVELAIAHFLDPDAVTFDDCQVGVRHDRVELLKQYYYARQTTAA